MPPKKPTTITKTPVPVPPPSNNAEHYIAQLTPMERKTLEIARQHLESSFSLEQSIGYQEWLKKQQQQQQH